MYRVADLQNCLFGLAGWTQNQNPDYPKLPDYLTESATGLYFQDEHALVDIENIDQAYKNFDQWKYPAYTEDEAYAIGDRVRYATDGKVYTALVVVDPAPLLLDPADWKEVDLLAQKLEALTRAAINKVATRVFIEKKLNNVTKSIFENVQLFDGAGNLLNKEIKSGRFVGFQVTLKNNRDLTTVIRRMGTQFSAVNAAFKLYIFHSSQEEPIQVFTKVLTKSNSFEWSSLNDYTFTYLSDDHAPGGTFYIGYYEEDLIGQAINVSYNWSIAPPCARCNGSYRMWSKWSPYVTVSPFFVKASDLVGIKPSDIATPTIWDVQKNNYEFTKNYGLNFDLTVKCDVTDFFCREKYLFTDAIVKQVTVDVLNLIGYSTRNNTISKETKDMALFELNNRDNKEDGAVSRLDKSIKALSFDVSDLNESCLPCNDSVGGEWGAI